MLLPRLSPGFFSRGPKLSDWTWTMTTALRPGRVVYAGAGDEFSQAARDLKELAELDVSAERCGGRRNGSAATAWRSVMLRLRSTRRCQSRSVAGLQPINRCLRWRACRWMAAGCKSSTAWSRNGTTRTPSGGNESRLLVEHEQRSFHGRSLSAVAGIVRGSGENATNGAGNQGFSGPTLPRTRRRKRKKNASTSVRTSATVVRSVVATRHEVRRSANFW